MASKLPIEVWQRVFLEFDSEFDRAEVYNCLLVSKCTNAAMQGPALLSVVFLRRTCQISQLFLYLFERPSEALHIKRLTFDLTPSASSEEQLSHELTPVFYLLRLCRELNYLANPPFLHRAYPQIVAAIRDLKMLQSLFLQSPETRLLGSAASICRAPDLGDVLHLVSELVHLDKLALEGYARIPPTL